MTLSLHGVTRLTSPRLQSLPSDIPYSPENSVLTTLLTDTSVHSYPLWLPGKAKQGISLEKDSVSRLWGLSQSRHYAPKSASSGCPGPGMLFPAPGVCHGLSLSSLSSLWMPKLSTHSLEEVAALPQNIPGNPQLSPAMPRHQDVLQVFAGASFRSLSWHSWQPDRKVSVTRRAVSHHLFLPFSQAFLFLFLFFSSLFLYHLHCTPWNGSNCLGSVSAPVCYNKQLFLRERSSCDRASGCAKELYKILMGTSLQSAPSTCCKSRPLSASTIHVIMTKALIWAGLELMGIICCC